MAIYSVFNVAVAAGVNVSICLSPGSSILEDAGTLSVCASLENGTERELSLTVAIDRCKV